MYNETGNTKPEGVKQPDLVEIVGIITQQLARWEGNTTELNGKIQKLKNYEEPKDAAKLQDAKSPTSLVDELYRIHGLMQDYNNRLEFSCRHLSSII